MKKFLSTSVEKNTFELLIDTRIYSKDIIIKSAYNFLDRGYFLFSYEDENIVLSFTLKDEFSQSAEHVLWEYSDELMSVYLRDTLEKENKVIREAIVTKAINGPLDRENFVSLDTDKQQNNEIDFDKDIDDILKEIENDPDLKIDEQEIENILKEIEEESAWDIVAPEITIDPSKVSWAKDMFKKKS